MATFKEQGTKAFTAKDYPAAVKHFTDAIKESPHDHTLYSNRSACYYNMNMSTPALEDADKCIEIKSDWDKGHQRRAMALHQLGRFDEAIAAYERGLQLNPSNAQITQGLEACRKEKAAAESDEGGMFGPAQMAKLMANPRIAGYFQDPKFRNTFEMCKQNPQMLMQLMQVDPRLMDVFKELTGIDLMDMQADQMKRKEQKEEDAKKRAEEEKKRQEEEARRKKEEEEAALPQEEKARIARKKEAETKKAVGNEHYKKKQFAEALAAYDEAIALDDQELVYHNNKAAVYFEMKDYAKCIAECDSVIERSKGALYDYVKLGKAYARKATAILSQGNFDEAIELYKTSLLENNDPAVKDQLKKAERMKKEDEERKMIDPEKAEEHRQAGNKLFEGGDYPAAVKEYTEGLKRDPKSKALYSNRCAAYIKLMEWNYGLKDAEKALQLDPNFVKAYARKGTIHHFMREYHKALATFDQGLKIDPENKECKEGKMKTMMAIQSGAFAGGDKQADEERLRHAMADPEIQLLMQDPRVRQLLKDLQENPVAGQQALRDPFLNEAFNKLIAAGVVKMG